MTRIGIIGGTFDPIHFGHVALARAAVASGRVDRIFVLPAGIPPHKPTDRTTFAAYRFAMVQKAFADLPEVIVSDIEILRQGNSYTIDTLRDFRSSCSDEDELVLIYGSDILADMHKWRQPESILREATLLLANRGGESAEQTLLQAERLRRDFGACIEFFDAPEIDLSSTQVREAIAAGRPLGDMLPEAVSRFIRKHDLYRREEAIWDLPASLKQRLREIERELWLMMSGKRLLHSLNVCRLSVELARIHGESMEAAALAGLLHDCAKDLPADKVLTLAERAGDPLLLAPPLAHGPAGMILARERFGISDRSILRAILYHTTGAAVMSPLDRIVFIADKVEPARTYQNLDEIRRLAPIDLDAAMRVCLDEICIYLNREGLDTHPYATDALKSIDGAGKTSQTHGQASGQISGQAHGKRPAPDT